MAPDPVNSADCSRAIPKSMILMPPSVAMRTFDGLMSRWITPRLWAYVSASRDRKSTRLNFSHSQISYAVFCLKKKKDVNSQTSALQLPCFDPQSQLTESVPPPNHNTAQFFAV